MAFIRPNKRTAAKNRAKAANYRKVCAEVDKRDAKVCRVCRIWDGGALHHHHIVFRSQGGKDTTENLITVCAQCHEDIHAHRISVRGNADAQIVIDVDLTADPTKGAA